MASIPDSVAFNALLDESLDNIAVLDAELRYVRVSRGAAAALELMPEQMAGHTWRELALPAALMEPIEAEWKRVLTTGETIRRQVEFRGAVREYVAFPLRVDGGITGIIAISRDVTELVRAQERYRGFMANSSEAIWPAVRTLSPRCSDSVSMCFIGRPVRASSRICRATKGRRSCRANRPRSA